MRCPRCGGETVGLDPCSVCGQTVVVPDVEPATEIVTQFRPDTPATLPVDNPPATRPTPAGTSHGPLIPGQTFGPRYRIIKLLGSGGMGSVYQAWDQELDVVVAIKVIRPEVLADPMVAEEIERRFKRELLLARQVTHRNVVRIHDIGEIDGIRYITMPYIHGSDLATILRRDGRMSVRRAVGVARQVVAGLVAAHEAGVVHRDLKPANVMIDAEDHALIMDFGIARSTSGGSAFGGTASGAIVGTVAYMAPEQAQGVAVDQRADVYSFGLILRDMLLGSRHAGAAAELAELMARMQEAPPPMRTLDATIPEDVDDVVTACLQPRPENRYQTSADLLHDLDVLAESEQGPATPARATLPGKTLTDKTVQGKTLQGKAPHAGTLASTMKAVHPDEPEEKRARDRRPVVLGGVAVLVLALAAGAWWFFFRTPPPPKEHEQVSVVIGDILNGTGDSTFDGSLEPMLKIALEDAGFISAFDRNGIKRGLGVTPPEKLTESAAREIAVKQGLGVVLSGTLGLAGGQYELSLKAVQAVTGSLIGDVRKTASSKTQVLGVATSLAAEMRRVLGDETSETAKRFAMETLSATSLAVVREYASAAEAMSRGKHRDAFGYFDKAVSLDPNFGLGYAGLAITSQNLHKQQDAEKYIKEAVKHLDGMTERERYRTRGLFYMITSDYQNCVKEYSELVAKYPADPSAHNNLALCSMGVRDVPRALSEVQKAVKILPKRELYRGNLAVYAAYAGDVRTAAEQATALESPQLYELLGVAFSQLLQGKLAEASATYDGLPRVDDQGASYRASGLGDIAIYEGRFSDAIGTLTKGAAADLASKDQERAADKFAAVAYAELARGEKKQAAAAAEKVLASSSATKRRFLAARVFVEADAPARAKELAASLGAELTAEPQAGAKVIDGLIALKAGDARAAAKSITEANALFDTWIGHFDLGRAYLEAGAFTQADSEFDRCVKRRGEALSLFLDEEPTFGHFPPVYYYQGRVREALKNSGFAESYKAYLAIRGNSKEDPLAADARKRIAS